MLLKEKGYKLKVHFLVVLEEFIWNFYSLTKHCNNFLNSQFNLMLIRKKKKQILICFCIYLFFFRFGLIPVENINITQISPNQTIKYLLPCQTNGPIQKMEPLTNLQVKLN